MEGEKRERRGRENPLFFLLNSTKPSLARPQTFSPKHSGAIAAPRFDLQPLGSTLEFILLHDSVSRLSQTPLVLFSRGAYTVFASGAVRLQLDQELLQASSPSDKAQPPKFLATTSTNLRGARSME